MFPAVLLALALAAPASPLPVAHAAAVCADFPNQAAAQRAHNTRDPDHDGIYCESLPCPCSTFKPTSSSPAPSAPAILSLGRSVALHAVTKGSGCDVRGRLPDPRCTPGARFSGATKAKVCRSGYSSRARNVEFVRKK